MPNFQKIIPISLDSLRQEGQGKKEVLNSSSSCPICHLEVNQLQLDFYLPCDLDFLKSLVKELADV